jgi:hypothetical protein
MAYRKYIYKTPPSAWNVLNNVLLIALFFYALINISQNFIFISILDIFILFVLFIEKSNILIIREDGMIIQRRRQFPFLLFKNTFFHHNEIESIESIKDESGNPFFFLLGLQPFRGNPKIAIKKREGSDMIFEINCSYSNLMKAINEYNKINHHH